MASAAAWASRASAWHSSCPVRALYTPSLIKRNRSPGRTSTGVIDAFVESIITNTPPAISGESAMHAMKVVFANEQSAQLGKAVDVQL